MDDFFQKKYSPRCKCAARTSDAIYKDITKVLFKNTSDNEVDVLVLLEHKEVPDRFDAFKKLCSIELKNVTYAIGSALGCTPGGFSSSDTISTYVKCKEIHIKKLVQQLHPKVIITTGRAIYSLTESKGLKPNHFFIPVNDELQPYQIDDSWFYTPEYDCKVFPLPALYQWIHGDIKNVYEREFSKQQFKRAISCLTEKKKRIVKPEFIEIIDHDKFLLDLIENKEIKKLAIDTETTGKNWVKDKLYSIQFSYDGKTSYFCLFEKCDKKLLMKLFKRKDIIFIYQNPQFDIKFLKQNGVHNARCDFDVMTASHSLNENSPNGLKILTWLYTNYGGYDVQLKKYIKNNKLVDFTKLPKKLLLEYACMDAIVTYLIQVYFEKRFDLEDKFVKDNYYNCIIPSLEMIIDVEMRGVQIDLNYMEEYSNNLKKEAIEIEQQIYQIAGKTFNLKSGKQLSEILRKLPGFSPLLDDNDNPLLTKTGDLILNKDTLPRYAEEKNIEFAKRIVKYNHITKEISQFGLQKEKLQNTLSLLPFFEDDSEENEENKENTGFMASIYKNRLYGGYKLYGTETGRMSGGGGLDSSINYQNMPTPQEFRKIFLPSDGYVIGKVDYDAMEVAIASQISGEGVLEQLILSGKDPHSYLAVKLARLLGWQTTYDEVFKKGKLEKDPKFAKLRDDAKTLSFQNLYGATKFGLANKFGIDLILAERFLKTYRDTFPEVARYIDNYRAHAKKYGWVKTLLGRKRRLPQLTYEGKDSNFNKQSSFDINNLLNTAINAGIQGTSGQTTLLAMVNINKEFKKKQMKSQVIINVHDEIVFELFVPEIEEAEKIIKHWTEFPYYKNNGSCQVRLTASLDYGEIWKSGHNTKYWKEHPDEWAQCLENIKIRNEKLRERAA